MKLSAGSIVPADGIVLDNEDFFVNQSALTGEAQAVEKQSGTVAASTELAKRNNCVFMGTTVQSGSATVLLTLIGRGNGGLAASRSRSQPANRRRILRRGIRKFGYLLTAMMLILTVFVFVINVLFHKPVIDSLLFSVALAVGITPQLLPAIINITLARGSRIMAAAGVIVRRLTAIENFGSMDTLCTDKTGTLTEGVIHLDSANGPQRRILGRGISARQYLNSSLQTGLVNSLDEAIIAYKSIDAKGAV